VNENATSSAFASAQPACAQQIRNLIRMEDAISSRCFPPFFEPVAVLDDFGPGTSPKLLGAMSAALNAWTHHIGYGTIARVRALTEPLVGHLLDGKLSIASILERTILENAGRAAFAVERLNDCARNNAWDDLRAVIPKTLFGTSMTALEGSVFEELSDLSAQRPFKPGQFINALENLAGTRATVGKPFFGPLYALLCDLAHASQRANGAYCRVLKTTAEGWVLQYTWEEEITADAIQGALKSTMRCLQAAYAASTMLLAWKFVDSTDGLEWHPALESDAEWIWRNLLDPSLVFG